MTHEEWARYALDLKDHSPTLCGIDLIRYEDAPAGLRERIDREGVTVFFLTDSD